MAFWGDYHTHTVYSHGKSTLEENVLRAISLGFREIGITDHGFKHMTFNVRRMDWPFIQAEALIMKRKYPQITIFLGLETNFNSLTGRIDIEPSDRDKLDLLIAGYHKFVRPSRFRDLFAFYIPNFVSDTIGHTSARLVAKNTDAYVRALEMYDIDIISHPNYGMRVDMHELARACRHYGTYMELNGKRVSISDHDLEVLAGEGAEFVCDSDAHSLSRIGDMSVPMAVIERVGIPMSQIANWERLPTFRSAMAAKAREWRA